MQGSCNDPASARPSVCPFDRHLPACCSLGAGSRYRSIAAGARAAAAGSVMSRAEARRSAQTCCRKKNKIVCVFHAYTVVAHGRPLDATFNDKPFLFPGRRTRRKKLWSYTHHSRQSPPLHRIVRPSVCVSHRSTAAGWTAGLLLSAVLAGDVDRQRRAPALSSNGAAARRSAANAGSAVLTADVQG